MNRKKITPSHLLTGGRFTRIIVAFAIFYLCGIMLVTPITYADGVPGGNISNPVVRAVDVAKPAVVRIITTLKARLTVLNLTTKSVTFPLSGSPYEMQLSGTGTFITAHGDILTADHVVQPPQDITDQILYQTAAQDIADFYNNLHPDQFVTAANVAAALTDGTLRSHSQYEPPSIRVYLSTDYTGPTNETTLDALPSKDYADVASDGILQTSDLNHGDTALIHVSMLNNDTPSIKLDDSTNVEQQDQLTIIGFPGNGDLPGHDAVTNAPDPSTGFLTASVNQMYVSAIKQNSNSAPLIQVGGNVEHGDSGGPALDSNGNIVGVVSFGGTDMPDGTSFLQASSTAQKLIDAQHLDTTPGAFQTAWNNAFTDYSSGNWQSAQQDMQKLQNNYPNFQAIAPFLNYATTQASKQPTTISASNPWLVGGLLVLVVLIIIFVVVLLLFLTRRKKNRQATQPAAYQPSYNGTGAWPASPGVSNVGNMAQMDRGQPNPYIDDMDKDKASPYVDGTDQNTSTITDMQSAQPRPMHSAPQMPVSASNAAQSGPMPAMPNQASPWPPQTPMAGYNATQSGPMPAMPNQMSPWPQPSGAPAYGQQSPYGQQPYNAGQPARPAQGGAYQPPAQQRQYAPYPQAPATPWGSQVPGHTPYAPPNAPQQDALVQRRQPSPNSGAAYGQPPQGYGTMPTPAQPYPTPMQPQVPVHPMSDASTTSEDVTVRVRQRSTAAPEEMAEPMEKKKNTAPSISAPGKDQTEMATIPGEQDVDK